jgi:hypothetical protein
MILHKSKLTVFQLSDRPRKMTIGSVLTSLFKRKEIKEYPLFGEGEVEVRVFVGGQERFRAGVGKATDKGLFSVLETGQQA